MEDINKSKEQLVDELAELRQRVKQLEASQAKDFHGLPDAKLRPPFPGGGNDPGIKALLARKYHISELIDIPLLQQLFDAFYELTGIQHAFLDVDANILTMSGWTDICLNFHRQCPLTETRCKASDQYINGNLPQGPYLKYRCLNGMTEYAIPIIVQGQHLATIYMGQLFNEKPDEDYFRKQAQEFGFDGSAYLEALRKVKIIPEQRIKPIMEFYSKLGKILASLGLERLRQLEGADKVLREREERLRLVLEASNDGFWDWDLEQGELYLSPRWMEILGYLPEEAPLEKGLWRRKIHPDDIDYMMKTFEDHLNGQTDRYEAEYRVQARSGEWKWIRDRGQVVARNEKGRPLRITGTILDITNRKQAEMALRLSEKKFSRAFHSNADPMTIATLKEWRYVEVNEAFLKSTGYEEHQVIGRTIRELGLWADPEQMDFIIKQIQEHGTVQNIETKYRTKSGEIKTVLISVEIIEIDGEAHMLISNRDITERKRMEEQLRLSEECFAKAFNASPLLMTISTLREGRFIKANRAFCRTTGYRRNDVIGKSSLELGFWPDPDDRNQIIARIMDNNESILDVEVRFNIAGGEQRIGLYSAQLLDVHGQPCLLSVIMDVTDLRKMEAEMTRLDRLNVVGEMAASIGHEIRNPMTTVRGYLQFLRENKDISHEEQYFDLMIEELDRANCIITEFLSLAKDKIVTLQPTNLNDVITKMLPLAQAKATSRDQSIKMELEDLPDVLLDVKEIRQLILNLLNNALESMGVGGVAVIRTFVHRESVVLAVQDRGHGIPPKLLEKLGTPFLTTKEQGTGLGLPVCYRIAARHNAVIEIETGSTGTTFYVRFPCKPV
ncbi:MAG: PAS domain S-box protein [Syntrophomonadaceae bacterium]